MVALYRSGRQADALAGLPAAALEPRRGARHRPVSRVAAPRRQDPPPGSRRSTARPAVRCSRSIDSPCPRRRWSDGATSWNGRSRVLRSHRLLTLTGPGRRRQDTAGDPHRPCPARRLPRRRPVRGPVEHAPDRRGRSPGSARRRVVASARRRSSATVASCSCSTTSSRSSRPRRPSQSCSNSARTSMSSSPAGRRCGSARSTSSRSRRCPDRRASPCSRIAARRRCRSSGTRPSWMRSSAGSTACHWRSSLPPPTSASSPPRRCAIGSPIGCRC